MLSDEMVNYGNAFPPPSKPAASEEDKPKLIFPNGKQTLEFDEFIKIIQESCEDKDQAENYLVYAFSMFDRKK